MGLAATELGGSGSTQRGADGAGVSDYEVQKLPKAQLFRGLGLQWPASAFQDLVPNV